MGVIMVTKNVHNQEWMDAFIVSDGLFLQHWQRDREDMDVGRIVIVSPCIG